MILESRSREYVEARIRAGVLEHGVAELFDGAGVGERMRREGLVHTGVELQSGRRAAPDRLRRAHRQVDRRLRADRDRQGPDRGAARERRARSTSRSPTSRCTTSTATGRGSATAHEGAEHELAVRRRRGLRRLPRRLPVEHPGRRPARVHARVPVRLARDPRCRRAVARRADLRAHRATASRCSACARPSSRASTSSAPRTRTSSEWPDERIWEELQARLGIDGLDAPRGADPREGRHADAELRRRADAVGASLSRRRRGAHRAADGREGAEPRDPRRAACSPRRSSRGTGDGDRALLDAYSDDVPAPRLARRALLVVDDDDAPPRARSDDEFALRLQQSQLRYLEHVPGRGDVARRELRRARPRLTASLTCQ